MRRPGPRHTYNVAYYAANRERLKAMARENHAVNREQRNAAKRIYYAKNRSVLTSAMQEYRARLRAIILTAKATGCVDCGLKDPRALDFDHVRGTKSFTISYGDYSPSRLLEEIAKCDVRCANCHRIQTAERRARWVA